MVKNQEPIKICHIIGNWVGGGVESMVMNYYRNIDKSKIQFDFLCSEESSNIPYEEIQSLGGRVILIPSYSKIFKYQKVLEKIFKKENYQIVHSHINALSVFPLRAAKQAGIPNRIAHSHSTSNIREWKKNLIKNLLRPFSKVYATDYFACTEHAGKWLFGKKIYKNGKLVIMNNAIDLSKFEYKENFRHQKREELGIEKEMLVIGHIGRFVKQKNHEYLIDIFYEIKKKNKNTILVLVGKGPLEDEIKLKVDELGLKDSVKFLGQRKDVNELYQAFDFFVFPSLYEGLGIVLIEAQCSGCYCLTSSEVPLIAKVTDNIEFLKLKDTPYSWAISLLEKSTKLKRNNFSKELSDNGFDITMEVNKLTEKYISLLER